MLRIAIATGGTGGHIFPAIAIAEELSRQKENSQITFIGSKGGMEKEIILEKGFDFESISVQKIFRFWTPKNFMFPYYLLKSIFQTSEIIRRKKIDIFIGCGGFVSGAAGLGAKKMGIPIYLQEQNSYPGLSTRRLASSSQLIFLGNPQAKENLHQADSRMIYTGNPIRKLKKVDRAEAKKFWGFDGRKVVFIYGGSQGALSINNSIVKILSDLKKENLQIIFQTGVKNFHEIIRKNEKLITFHESHELTRIKKNLEAVNICEYSCNSWTERVGQQKSIIVKPFIEKMQLAYSASDLVVCRAGAVSLSEIAYFGLPSILIPFPESSGNHQKKNAFNLKNANAAEVMLDKNISPNLLKDRILEIISDDEKSKNMSAAIKKFARPESAKNIVKIILRNIEQRNKNVRKNK